MSKNLSFAKQLTRELELPMKILSIEENEDEGLTLLYSSPTRVDFRDFVKKLQDKTKRKITMREVNPRDEAKFTTGVGPCGRKLCCITLFKTSSSLPSGNLPEERSTGEETGMCGKRMCCLSFEEKTPPSQEETPQKATQEKATQPLQLTQTKEIPENQVKRILRVLPRKKPRHRR